MVQFQDDPTTCFRAFNSDAKGRNNCVATERSGGVSHDLSKKRCIPCEGGIPTISPQNAGEFLKELQGWELSSEGRSIRIEYPMKDFASAIRLVDTIAQVAEAENHHPDIHLTGYRRLVIELSTHAIGGLSENDFILAAKIQKLPKDLKIPK